MAVVEGMVAGLTVTSADIADQLARRRLGYGRGARMKFERDQVTVLAGVRHGVTLGGPIAIEIGNTEWPKWETVMAPDPVDAAELVERGADRFYTDIKPNADRNRRGCVQNIVHAGDVQGEFAEIVPAITHAKPIQRVPHPRLVVFWRDRVGILILILNWRLDKLDAKI